MNGFRISSILLCGLLLLFSFNHAQELTDAVSLSRIAEPVLISPSLSLSSISSRLERYFLFEGYGKGDNKPEIDLTFIMQSSSSISSLYFNNMRQFIVDLLRYFSVSRSNTRVALVTLGSRANIRFDFNKYLNRKCLTSAILSTPYPSGYGYLESAVYSAYNLYRTSRYGRRMKSKKLVFILTDQHNRATYRLRDQLRRLQSIPNSKIYTIGIGKPLTSSSAFYNLGSLFRYRYYYQVSTPWQVGSLIRYMYKLKPIDKCCTSFRRVVYDECNRRCYCRFGRLYNCKRVRKAMCSMTSAEKTRFLAAYKQLSTDPVYKTRFDNLRTLHATIFPTGIHSKSQFLPWHRWYILEVENMLQEIDCRITVPYWAWSLRPNDAWSASSIWGVGSDGLGGNGVPAWGCVSSGQFRISQYSIPDMPPSPTGRCLERGFNGSPPNQVQIAMLLQMTDFTDFELYLRGNLHDNVHCMIGGTMCSREAASAPEFFLHHGYVDKLWGDWQKKSFSNKYVYFPGISGTMQSTSYQRKDLIRLESQPGCISVVYDQPNCNNAIKVEAALSVAPLSLLKSISPPPKPFDTTKTRKLFVLNKEESARLASIEKEMQGSPMVSRKVASRESDVSSVLGFEVNRLELKPVTDTDNFETTDAAWNAATQEA